MNLGRNILGALGINKENLPEGMIRDPNTGKVILDPNRADTNVIMGQSDPGLLRSTSRLQAENNIKQQMKLDRMRGLGDQSVIGDANVTGLSPQQFYTDPKDGTTYALADTSAGAGVQMTQKLPDWVTNPPEGFFVEKGVSRDRQLAADKAQMNANQKSGGYVPYEERHFSINPNAKGPMREEAYTLHPIPGYGKEETVEKPTEEELIKQELEDTRPDTTTTAPPPPPPETPPPIARPKVPVGEGPVSDDSIPTPDNTGLDLNLDEFAPPKKSPVGQDYSGFDRAEDRLISELARKANLPPVENKTIEEEQLVSEDPRLDQRSSDPQRRVLAEEAYGGPIENPPPMDDEIIKKLISSDPSVDEQRLVDSGMDAETAAYFADRKTPQMSAGPDDELLQKMVEPEFVGPRQGPRELTPKYEDQGPITPLRSEGLRPRTQAFVDPSASGFGDKTEPSPNQNAMTVDQGMRGMPPNAFSREEKAFVPPYLAKKAALELEDDRRRRAEEIVNEKFGSQGSLTGSPLLGNLVRGRDEFNREEEIKKTIENLKREEDLAERTPVLFGQGPEVKITSSEDEVIPISEGEEAVNQVMIEDRSRLDDLEPIPAKAREARIDPVTQMATPATEEQDQGSNIFSSLLGQLGQTVKDNPEVAAQLAQLAGNLLSGSAQNRAQRKADAETQRRLGRANMIGAFTGKTPGVQSATADTGGLFSLDTLGKALTGGGQIATGEMERRVQEAENKRVADLEASKEAREQSGFEREGEQFDETLAFQNRKLAQDNVLERLGLSLEEKNLLQRKEYQNEILRLQRDRLGLDATNMYYEAVARANQANNTKTDEKPLTPSEIAKLSGKISTLDQVSRAREEILDAAEDGKLSFLELGPLSLENAPQYIFGSDQAKAKSQIEELVNIVAQTLPGNPSDKENQRVERMLMKMTDRPITIDAIADLFLESHMLSLNNELTGLTKSGYKTGWAYDLVGNYDQRYGEGAEEGQFDALAQEFIQGGGN